MRNGTHTAAGAGRAGGFTLAELIVVIVILMIAAAIVIPNIGTASDTQATSAARTLASDLEMARNLALMTQRPHTVLFSPTRQSYKIVADYSGGTYAATQAIPHPVVVGKRFEVTLAEHNGMGNVQVTNVSFGGDARVTFDALGDPSSAGTITLQTAGMQMEVSVAGLTGSVSTHRVTN